MKIKFQDVVVASICVLGMFSPLWVTSLYKNNTKSPEKEDFLRKTASSIVQLSHKKAMGSGIIIGKRQDAEGQQIYLGVTARHVVIDSKSYHLSSDKDLVIEQSTILKSVSMDSAATPKNAQVFPRPMDGIDIDFFEFKGEENFALSTLVGKTAVTADVCAMGKGTSTDITKVVCGSAEKHTATNNYIHSKVVGLGNNLIRIQESIGGEGYTLYPRLQTFKIPQEFLSVSTLEAGMSGGAMLDMQQQKVVALNTRGESKLAIGAGISSEQICIIMPKEIQVAYAESLQQIGSCR